MSELLTTESTVKRHLVRAEIEQFYAAQMALLDEGNAERWVETFTEDGVFVPPTGAPVVQGRSALLAGTRQTIDRLTQANTVRRHVLTNLNLAVLADGTAEATAYVLVVDSTDGEARITTSTVMRDKLLSDENHWYVARREVRRDDLLASEK